MLWLTELGGLIFIGSRRRHRSSGATGAIHHVSQPLAPPSVGLERECVGEAGAHFVLCFTHTCVRSLLYGRGGSGGRGLHAR